MDKTSPSYSPSFRPRPNHPLNPAAFDRLTQIHQTLLERGQANIDQLATLVERSARTIKRDLERLRNIYAAPLAWDATTRAYHYTEPYDLLSGLRLTSEELFGLLLASRAVATWGGTPLGHTILAALRKFAQAAGQHVTLPGGEIDALLTTETTGATEEHRFFLRLLEHIREQRTIGIAYQKLNRAEPETRTVNPQHLAYLDHCWVLIALDIDNGELRKFRLNRIRRLTTTGGRFTSHPPEIIRTYLRGSMGRYTGDAEHAVELVADAQAAPYLRETPWHRSQEIAEQPDGSIKVSLRLNNLIDIERRILANGGHVRSLSPPELVAALRASAQALLTAHP